MAVIISLALILTVVVWSGTVIMLRRFRLIEKTFSALDKQYPLQPEEIRERVWVTNDKNYRTFFKITPSTEFGILSITPQRISLYLSDINGKQAVQQIDRINLHAEWLGNKPASYKSYNMMQWFAIADVKYSQPTIYLSAYTGLKSAFTGKQLSNILDQTREIYVKLTGQKEQIPETKLFALEKNPASLSALIITAILLVYAAIDGLIINPLELVGYRPEILPLIFALIVISYIVFSFYKIMRKKSVPLPESMCLTIVFCVVLILAAIPVIKRIDTATAVEPMQNYEYKANEKDVLEPLQEGLPKLPLKTKNEYWQQFKDDHIFRFPLQKGGFGFWQFDGRELDKDIEAFYANKSEDKNNKQPESDEQ